MTNGWSSAETGGAYQHQGLASNYSVGSGAGHMSLPAGGVGIARLPTAQAVNVDLQVRISSDKLAAGGTQFAYLLARSVPDIRDYRGALLLAPGGGVSLTLQRYEGGTSTIVPKILIPGLTHTANGFVWMRLQVLGTNPTRLRLKAWASGQPEPADWQLRATDTTASLQAAGGVGLQASLQPSTTNAPVRVSFDDFQAQAIPLPVAEDSFSRSVANGWDTAEFGGAYALEGLTSNYAVTAGRGTMNLAAGSSTAALLSSTQGRDLDARVRISSDKLAAGAAEVATLLLRQTADGSQYRAHLQFETNRSLRLRLSRFAGGSEMNLGTPVSVSGLTHTANGFVWLRAQVSGTSPTTLRVKAWADGSLEPPAWLLHAKDSTASLQVPGAVGLRGSLGAAASNAPVRLAFDDLLVVPTVTTVAADSFARTISGGWGVANLGGPYGLDGATARYGVASGLGTLTLGAGENGFGLLSLASARDATALVRLSADKLAVGGEQRAQVMLRADGAGTAYLSGVIFAANGNVRLRATRLDPGVETRLSTDLVVPGLTQGANGFVWLRTQVVGNSPTTLRLKAWAEGQPEPPSWQLTVTDATASLQDAGMVGLRGGLGAATSNAPVRLAFDDLWVTTP